MKSIYVLILTLVFNASLFAQSYTGQAFDEKTKQPLSYVSIGIMGKSIGTISDANGVFHISIDGKYTNDSISIFLLGYKSINYKCADFIAKNKVSDKYFLKEVAYNLSEVVVTPKNLVSETVGNVGGSVTQVSFKITDSLHNSGAEIGTYVKIKQKFIFIDSIGFGIAENDYDSVKFRVNIYKGDGNKALENITKKPIYVTAKKGAQDFNLDVRSLNITSSGDFIIAAQVVDFPKYDAGKVAKKFSFKGRLIGRGFLFRNNPFSEWEKIPLLSAAFHASVSYAK